MYLCMFESPLHDTRQAEAEPLIRDLGEILLAHRWVDVQPTLIGVGNFIEVRLKMSVPSSEISYLGSIYEDFVRRFKDIGWSTSGLHKG